MPMSPRSPMMELALNVRVSYHRNQQGSSGAASASPPTRSSSSDAGSPTGAPAAHAYGIRDVTTIIASDIEMFRREVRATES